MYAETPIQLETVVKGSLPLIPHVQTTTDTNCYQYYTQNEVFTVVTANLIYQV